MRTKMAAKWTS